MRAFIAIPIDPSSYMKNILSTFRQSRNIKVVEDTNVHITLKFLGDIDDDFAKKICSGLSGLKVHKFTIKTLGIGAFPNMRSPRVIFLDLQSNDIEKLYIEIGRIVGIDKDFVPHITIGRIKAKVRIPPLEFTQEEYEAKEVCLFSSRLTPSGPIYSRVCCKALE
ncbi:hypothetical protein [Thermoplasma volcanium GSS1]|uniref:RNA 2',3'-cyclic phosphodiesterase n=1 Tax=Thermoplasma volcanium (strain ATCC 51530 / DSM 4299 / JCM 9571 / NBRC 15438 / GSS1) TaxID=273116 RepID=Q97CN6_THEVO|nr:RNA 2',3'-cyclic phosphodiesterase [Thermoplasma volcanium]BAB59207.1 hypothetical protein [Thermoplasma volcanium GSS1]